MGRRKKEITPEKPVEMINDAMNIPVEEANEPVLPSEDPVEALIVDAEAPSIEEPISATIEPIEIKIAPKKISCTASRVNVREKPDGDVLYTIPNLSKVMVEKEENGWCKIVGYVMSELVKEI